MYSLDINFLNDRAEQAAGSPAPKKGGGGPSAANTPMIIGALVGLALPAGAFGANLYLQSQLQAMTANRDGLQGNLSTVSGQAAEVNAVTEQIAAAQADIEALIGVFQKLQPISASLQEVSNQTPPGVKIKLFESKDGELPEPTEAEAAAAAAAAAAAPPPVEGEAPPAPEAPPKTITIEGLALSYAQLNDFMLGLKNSPFLVKESVKLGTVELKGADEVFQFERLEPELPPGEDPPEAIPEEYLPQFEIGLPYVVEFSLNAELSSPAPEDVLAELEALQATGTVVRVKALQSMGVISE